MAHWRDVVRSAPARLFTAFTVVILGVVPLSSTAWARTAAPSPTSTGGGVDPTGDVSPFAQCEADITAFSGDYTDQTIFVSTGLACGSDPNSDAHWVDGLTEADWGFDINGDNQLDYIAAVFNLNGFRATVHRVSDRSLVCEGTAHWDGDKTFGASFDSSCIEDPPSFRLQSYMQWDETAGQGTCTCPFDLAPDGTSLTGDIGRSSAPPPLGYPTACNRTDTASGAFADAGLAADCLKAWGIALGKSDGTFGENDSLLRSQVSSLLARLLTTNGIELTQRRTFPDVNANTVPNSQVRDEIEHLAGIGIIVGFSDGTFGPAGTLSVAQSATFLVRTLQVLNTQLGSEFDVQDQGTTSANYGYAIHRGIIDPQARNSNGSVYPNNASDTTKRGLLADMMAQSLEKLGKVYYASCTEVQSAGAAPLFMGDSGYRPALDPDGDGIACE